MAFPKRLAAGILALTTLFGCSTSTESEQPEQESEPISILCPSGAPALASLGAYDENVVFEYTQGQDLLVSELSKSDSEFDVIIAPINLGVKTASQSDEWKAQAVLTWGNLYILSRQEEDWNQEDRTLAAFGQGAVPGLVLEKLYDPLLPQTNWLPSVAEASAALLAGESESALLAEPQLYMTQKKLGEQDLQSYVLADLQEEWHQRFDTGHDGYPQAALFSKTGVDVSDLLDKIAAFANDPDAAKISERIDEIGAETLGTGSREIALDTWSAQHIDVQSILDVKDDVELFLEIFGMNLPESILETK